MREKGLWEKNMNVYIREKAQTEKEYFEWDLEEIITTLFCLHPDI